MLPVANFVANQVSGPEIPPEGRRRTDVRGSLREPTPEAESLARAYLASLPRWRRVSLALRVPTEPGR